MSLKLRKLNIFQNILSMYPIPWYSRRIRVYREALDDLTLSRIERLRKFMFSSSSYAKELVLKTANAIAENKGGPFSRSQAAMILLSAELQALENNPSH